MRLGGGERPEEASFDLTPLIDVVLLLIIFFMLSSQFSRSQPIYVELPSERGDPSATPASEASFVIEVNARGEYAVLGKYVDLADIPRLLGLEARTPLAMEKLDVIVRADKHGASAALNRLADALAKAGVRSFRLATSPGGAATGGGK